MQFGVSSRPVSSQHSLQANCSTSTVFVLVVVSPQKHTIIFLQLALRSFLFRSRNRTRFILKNKRYEMLERSTASSSAKSNRALRRLAPAPNRKRYRNNSAESSGGGGLSRAASPAASGDDHSLASAAKRTQRQQQELQQGLRGVLQGGDEMSASPRSWGADLSPPGTYPGRGGGSPENPTGMDKSSGKGGHDPGGGGSPAAVEEDGRTAPALQLFRGTTTSSPSEVPSPSVRLLGPPPPEEAWTASSGHGAVAGSAETEADAVVNGTGLRNAARGLDDDGEGCAAERGGGNRRTAVDNDEEEGEGGEEERKTECQRTGMEASPVHREARLGRKGFGPAEEESETDTVHKCVVRVCFCPCLDAAGGHRLLLVLDQLACLPILALVGIGAESIPVFALGLIGV